MHTITQNNDLSLDKQFQQNLSKVHRKNKFIDQVKCKKMLNEIKSTDREYHVQDNADVEQKDMKMYCNTKRFPALPFCGPYSKHHGAREFRKHYHLRFNPKLGNIRLQFMAHHQFMAQFFKLFPLILFATFRSFFESPVYGPRILTQRFGEGPKALQQR